MLPWIIIVGLAAFLGAGCLGMLLLARYVRSQTTLRDAAEQARGVVEARHLQRMLLSLEQGDLDQVHGLLLLRLDLAFNDLANGLRGQSSPRVEPELTASLSRVIRQQKSYSPVRPSMKGRLRRTHAPSEAEAFLASLLPDTVGGAEAEAAWMQEREGEP